MAARNERDLRNSPIFCSEDKSLWDNRDNMPWPSKGESLLAKTMGAEEFVYPYTEWIPNDLARLSFFALQYRNCARDMVRLWLTTQLRPDNLVYVVGFLYRHAVELELKAILVRSARFTKSDEAEQRALLQGHSLHRIWNNVRPILEGYTEREELQVFEAQLFELHELDSGSDGFRYPFGFVNKQGTRKELLDGLAFTSFDNFVWILDGLVSWLQTTADMEEQYKEYLKEYARDAGF